MSQVRGCAGGGGVAGVSQVRGCGSGGSIGCREEGAVVMDGVLIITNEGHLYPPISHFNPLHHPAGTKKGGSQSHNP